jgi:hypothetical protein
LEKSTSKFSEAICQCNTIERLDSAALNNMAIKKVLPVRLGSNAGAVDRALRPVILGPVDRFAKYIRPSS